MIYHFCYNLSAAEDIQHAAEENKKIESAISQKLEEALSPFQNQFTEKDITYEIRFLQGEVEVEIMGVDQENELKSAVKSAMEKITYKLATNK